MSTKAPPVLDDNNFSLCRPRHSSKELAILETEITRVKRVFSIDPVLAQQVEAAIEKFNRENNPSGVPWKEKRPNPGEEVTTIESTSRGVFLKAYASPTIEELEADGAHVFEHAATPRANLKFKMYIPADGSKVYIQAEDDGILYFPLARFIGTFLQGQPATTAMQGGSQWIEWKYESVQECVVACKKES